MMIKVTSQVSIRESSPSVTVVCEAVIVTFGASRERISSDFRHEYSKLTVDFQLQRLVDQTAGVLGDTVVQTWG